MRAIRDLMNLSGRVALVTGGAGHIGLAICETLLELGAHVVILDADEALCQKRVTHLNTPDLTSWVSADLSDEAATRDAVQQVVARRGRLDILIHAAAFVGTTQYPGWAVPFEAQSVAAWDAALRVNLTAAFVLVQTAKPALEASGHGAVILLSSIYGMAGPDMRLYEGTSMAMPAAYAASKGGIIQFVRYFSTLLAPHIRVNALTPGGVWRNQPESFHTRYRERTPMQRMAVEEDVKGAIAYLASDLSAYVTGQNVVVDGGWTAW